MNPQPPTTVGKRVTARTERSRQAALEATLDLVAEVGIRRITTDAVASRAGVSKATMYRLWDSKTDLLVDAVATLVSEIRVPDTGSLREDLRELMREAAHLYSDSRPARIIPELISEMSHNPQLADMFRGGWLRQRRSALEQVLSRARDRGDLRPDLDLEICLDLIGGVVYYRFLVTGGELDDRFADLATDALLGGLAPTFS